MHLFKCMFLIINFLSANAAYAACNLNNTPNIDGLRLGITVKELIKLHPTMEYKPDVNKREGRLVFPDNKAGELKSVAGFGHIATLDNVVYSYFVIYDDFDTPLKNLKNKLAKRYSLPDNGWQKSGKDRLKLRGGDIELTISQDFGEGRATSGAGLFAKLLPIEKIADSLR